MYLISHNKILIFLILSTLICCKRDKKPNIINNETNFVSNIVPVEDNSDFYQQAKFFDIPIPLGILPIKNEITSNAFSYSCNQQVNDLIKFYEIEMESLGWNKISEFYGFESLLFYEKPNKYLLISIRQHNEKNNLKVNIFIMNKNLNKELE